MGDRQHRHPGPAQRDRAPGHGPRGRVGALARQGGPRRRRPVRPRPPRAWPPRTTSRSGRARRRLRALHAPPARRRRGLPPARRRQQRRHDPRRVPPPAQHGPGPARPRGGRLRRGRHVDPQHRQQPRLHHRGRAAGAVVDPAPARPADHRRVRRPVAAALPRPAVQDHGLRPARGRVRRGAPAARAGQLRPVVAAPRRRARPPARRRRGQRRVRGRQPHRRDRGGHDRGRLRRPPSG